VIAFTVSQRTRELGIRIALGARSGQVVRMVVREGLTLVAAGGAIGLVLALVVAGPLSGALLDVPRVDLLAFGAVPVLFAVVAAVASWIPGRRASRVEPVVALRYD
jgi:ABC-type antimicrobial peptide transport system permease subunit